MGLPTSGHDDFEESLDRLFYVAWLDCARYSLSEAASDVPVGRGSQRIVLFGRKYSGLLKVRRYADLFFPKSCIDSPRPRAPGSFEQQWPLR